MPGRLTFYLIPQLLICTSAFAQSTTPAATTAGRTFWDHNGSVVYLVANGSSREFYYQKPRLGMLDAGAHLTLCYSAVKSTTDNSLERRMSSTRNAGKFRSKSKGPFSRMAEGLR
jgi:hypothetical protein